MPVVARPQPTELDIMESMGVASLEQPAPTMLLSLPIKSCEACFETKSDYSSATQTPSAGERSFKSCTSLSSRPSLSSVVSTPFAGMPTTTARDAALNVGQYPPGVGWTPLARQAPQKVGFGLPKSSPTASLISLGVQSPTSSMVAISTKLTARSPTSSFSQRIPDDRAFPPGFGFTPLAAAGLPLSRSKSFGFSNEAEDVGPGGNAAMPNTAVPATPVHFRRENSKLSDDQSICKELLLLLRNEEEAVGLSPEGAGFVWPQPGWLRAFRTAKELSPASAVGATVTNAKSRLQLSHTSKSESVSRHPQSQTQVLHAQCEQPLAESASESRTMTQAPPGHFVAAGATRSSGAQQFQSGMQHTSVRQPRYHYEDPRQQTWQTWSEDWSWKGGRDWEWDDTQQAANHHRSCAKTSKGVGKGRGRGKGQRHS